MFMKRIYGVLRFLWMIGMICDSNPQNCQTGTIIYVHPGRLTPEVPDSLGPLWRTCLGMFRLQL